MQVDERTLFVCPLPSDIKHEEVKQIFETYGPVIKVDIMDTANTPNEQVITLHKQEGYWIGMDMAGEEPFKLPLLTFGNHCQLFLNVLLKVAYLMLLLVSHLEK